MKFLIILLITGCRTVGTIPFNGFARLPSVPTTAAPAQPSIERPLKQSAEYNEESPKDYDPFPDIDGYSHASTAEEIFDRAPDREGLISFSKKVIIIKEAPANCKFEDFSRAYLRYKSEEDRDQFLRVMASEHYSNTVHLIASEIKEDKVFIKANFYNCPDKAQRPNYTNNLILSKNIYEIDMLMGSYVSRTGFLKLLGKTGPTLGFTFHYFSKENSSFKSRMSLGWYMHFNFDHFFETDSTLLDPKFIDEDYTNYLWSFGASVRYLASDKIQFNYDIGPAINFLEIDTNRTNTELSDEEATRTTFSLVHQLSANYRIQNSFKYNNYKHSDKLLGINFLYYWMPDALGKFAAHNSSF